MFIRRWIKWCYNYMIFLAGKPNAMYFLFVLSFMESSFFPIPPDIMMIPMILAAPKRAWHIATVCLVASVLGGYFGYAIGYWGYDAIAEPILSFYGYIDKFEEFKRYYHEYGAWIVFIGGITPFPYKVITITSGAMHLDLWVFGLASIVARGIRLYLIAWLLYKYGAPIEKFIEKHLGVLSIVFVLLLIGGLFAIKYL